MSNKVKERQILSGGAMNYIDAGIGYIKWSSDNLQLMAIMEAIEEKLKTKSPNDIAAGIERL